MRTDDELMLAYRAGDIRAFEELFESVPGTDLAVFPASSG